MNKQSEVVEHGNKAVVALKQQLHHLTDKAQEVSNDVREQATKIVKKNPLRALAIATGIGFLLGLFIKKR